MSSPDRPVVLSPRANRDYANIVLHGVRTWGIDRARDYQADLMKAIDRLGEYPEMGRARDDLSAGCRSFPVKRHVVYYRVDDTGVTVLRILHGRMDPTGKVGR